MGQIPVYLYAAIKSFNYASDNEESVKDFDQWKVWLNCVISCCYINGQCVVMKNMGGWSPRFLKPHNVDN